MSDRFDNWDKYIDPRIEKLLRNDFYLEAFYLCSATIEHMLQGCIYAQEQWINILLEKTEIQIPITPDKELKNKPLGELIKMFSKYCKNEILISQLNSFNSFRVTLVHKVLDYDLEILNNTAKTKLPSYHQLVAALGKYGYTINAKIIRSLKRSIKNKEAKILKIK